MRFHSQSGVFIGITLGHGGCPVLSPQLPSFQAQEAVLISTVGGSSECSRQSPTKGPAEGPDVGHLLTPASEDTSGRPQRTFPSAKAGQGWGC